MHHPYLLQAMGIPIWQLRNPSGDKHSASSSWQDLQEAVANCKACSLHCSRTQTVFGVGHQKADLMIIGEAPGFYEDKQGEPFVGRAGQLLNAMLQSIQLDRKMVYIANILKCRPPSNRDPLAEEVNLCTPFLNQQINLIQPKLLLALGRIAARYLLNNQDALSSMRGKIFSYGVNQIPLIVTYHPAYLLRNPKDKGNAWQDWQLVKKNCNVTAM